MIGLCVLILSVVITQQIPTSIVEAKLEVGLTFTKCCEFEDSPAMIQFRKSTGQMMEECDQELGGIDQDKTKYKHVCLAHCIAKKVNAINEDGTLHEEGYKRYVANEMATQDYLRDIAENVTTRCAEAHKSVENIDMGNGFPCFAECMFKKNNLLNKDNTMNEDAFKQFIVNEVATQDYQKPVAETIATECAEAAKQADAEPEVAGASKCSKMPMKVFKCVMSGMMGACPAEMQSQDEHCVKMRGMVKKDFKPPA